MQLVHSVGLLDPGGCVTSLVTAVVRR